MKTYFVTMKINGIVIAVCVFLLAPLVSAWHENTREVLARDLCDAIDECRRQGCAGSFVEGALEPDRRFGDGLSHICRRTESGTYHCEVYKKIDEWLAKAAEETGCQRFYYAGVASNYFFDSKNPFSLAQYDFERCQRPFEREVEEHFARGHFYNWSECACRACVNYGNFIDWRREFIDDYHFAVRGSDVVLVGNSIDLSLADGLVSFLQDNDFNVTVVSAATFSAHRNATNVVFLGGHRAPEGVGDLVGEALTPAEKDFLVSVATSQKLFLKRDVWREGQVVWIFAGHEKKQTQRAWQTEKERLLFSKQSNVDDECGAPGDCPPAYTSDYLCRENNVAVVHYTPLCRQGECIYRTREEIIDKCLDGWYCVPGVASCQKRNVTSAL